MKIGIHNETWIGPPGGCEVSVAILAEGLARTHEVEIVHHRPNLTAENLGRYADADLSRVRLVEVPRPGSTGGHPLAAFARHRGDRALEYRFSSGYDVFVSFTHGMPPFCGAPVGILMVLFPSMDLAQWSTKLASRSFTERFRLMLQWAWHRQKLRMRLRTYQVWAANSQFTRRWAKQRWRVDCQVVYPPVNVDVPHGEKADRILSVGRFAVFGHGKKQVEMMEAFQRLQAANTTGWQYDCAGASGSSVEEIAFLERVRQLAASCGARVHDNISREDLNRLYQSAKIFWHAAGLNDDENANPERSEHFGMTTVEAMSAGCVPVVINKGGQPEIVQHGVNGFLWDTIEEWQRYSLELIRDSALLAKMSAAARERAHCFSREAYIARFHSLLAPYLAESSGQNIARAVQAY